MSYVVKATDLQNISLNESDVVTSVLQNVAIILNTWQGEVPLYRDFGLPPEIMHKPMNVAKQMLRVSIIECIEAYEPRASVKSITFDVDKNEPDKLIPTVELEVNE